MTTIYILKLKNNKFYIGKSSNTNIRIKDHLLNKGSKWTKIYKPIKVIEIIPNSDIFDEDKYTIKYMSKYGIDYVRGGYFSQPILTSTQIYFLIQMIRGANDKCYHCGLSGHFISDCKNKTIIKNKQIPTLSEEYVSTLSKDNYPLDTDIYSSDKVGIYLITKNLFKLIEEFIYGEI